MQNIKSLEFERLNASISLDVDHLFLEALPKVFCNWPYDLSCKQTAPCFASIRISDQKYEISSEFMDRPISHTDSVNALCSLIVELAWAHLRADPSLLCLHGAAVEVNGRLVIFPSTRRAGKSTLSVAMMASELKLYTDDFLPLVVGDNNRIYGLSHGIAPRLRLPLPDQIGKRTLSYIAKVEGLSNRQYRYVTPHKGGLAEFGEACLPGALVFLERISGAVAKMRKVDPATALKSLIKQNFSRAMNAAGILATFAAIVKDVPAYVLEYDEIDQTVGLIKDQFLVWDNQPATVEVHGKSAFLAAPDLPEYQHEFDWKNKKLIQAEGVTDLAMQGERFLAAPTGREILHLNPVAAIIWQLLAEQASSADLTDMMVMLYPDQPRRGLTEDLAATLAKFANLGLIKESNGSGSTFATQAPGQVAPDK